MLLKTTLEVWRKSNVRAGRAYIRLASAVLMIMILAMALPRPAFAQFFSILLTAPNRTTLEDTPITTALTVQLIDIWGGGVWLPFNRAIRVSISGIPSNWTVNPNGGTYSGGVWTLTHTPGTTFYSGGPTLTPPADSDVDLNGLVATASIVDLNTNTILQSTSRTFNIIVDAVADDPALTAVDVAVAAGAVAPLTLTSGLTDQDGSEVMNDIKLMGVPSGFTLSAGTDLGGGVWQLNPTDLPGLTITPTPGFEGTVKLTLTGFSAEINLSDTETNYRNNISSFDTETFTVTWGTPAPPPPPPPPPGANVCYQPLTGGTRGSVAAWDNAIRGRWMPVFVCMTHQFTVTMMHQVLMVGALIDAKTQLETQRLTQQMAAEAHKDYRPSTQMCRFGTNVRSLAASEEKMRANTRGLNNTLIRRAALSANTSGAGGPRHDKNNRLQQFAERYCDLNDNNGQLAAICRNGSGPTARRNRDVDFTRTLENRYTIDYDVSGTAGVPADPVTGAAAIPAATHVATADEEDIVALANNIFAHDIFSEIPPRHLEQAYAKDEFQEVRSVNAIRSVAFNSFSHIVGMRSAGSPAANEFMKNVLMDMGIPLTEISELLGQKYGTLDPLNLSYFAQMEVLTKKMFQSPAFFTNLYDTPDNVHRTGVTIQAFKLMNDRDRFESALRREMLISMILELKLREAQTGVNNSILQGVSDMFPKR